MTTQHKLPNITDLERTINYIQFQLNDTIQTLDKFYASDAPKIQYVHLVEYKKELEKELQAQTAMRRRPVAVK